MRVPGTVAAVLLLTGCTSSGLSSSAPTVPDVPTSHAIVYYIGGARTTANLTLTIHGQQSQQNDVDVPLHNKNGAYGLRFDADPGEFLYVSAQNQGDGTITCRIAEDGLTIVSNESSGEFAIVTCDGSA